MSARVPSRGGQTGTTIAPTIIDRISGAFRGAFDGWFGPGRPLKPQAPADFEPRTWDYPTFRNVGRPPRDDGRGTGVSFEQLRALSENCTIVRLCVETRKDQLAKLKWEWRAKSIPGEKPGETQKRTESDARIKDLTAFFRKPDLEHDWSRWLRLMLEDALVIDAVTLYRRDNLAGGPYALEVFDGGTINRVLDKSGRTPVGIDADGKPLPAYQQWIKGIPAIDFSDAELLYFPRNPRPNRTYGYSPVEQLVVYVNLALRRTAMQMGFYTDGNLPGALLSAPTSWQPDAIKRFQDYWDAQFEGVDARKHRGQWVPEGTKLITTAESALKDEFDEWLARMTCFCFGISPNFFIKQMNRASAQTFWEQADAEGMLPWMDYVTDVMNEVVSRPNWWGYDDIEFAWQPTIDEDPDVQMQIDTGYVKAGIWSINEVRGKHGMDPVDGGDEHQAQQSGGFGQSGKPPAGGETVTEELATKAARAEKKTAGGYSRSSALTRRLHSGRQRLAR